MGMNKTITLKVAEAYHRDVGRGIARLAQDLIGEMDLEGGAVVEIQGKKTTAYAVVWQSSSKEAKDVIRIDGNLRGYLGVGIDDRVAVRKSEARPAKRVVVAPTTRTRLIGGPQYLLRTLLGRPVVKGEQLRIEMISSSLGFVVVSTAPKGPVVVAAETEIKILKETLEEMAVREISYEDIGGLTMEIRMVREMIELPLRHPRYFRSWE